jgi:hypothetical protein
MNGSVFNRVFSVRIWIAIAILLTELVFLNYRLDAGFAVLVSSATLSAALLAQLRYGVREDSSTPADIAVFIFNWLFLDLAPKIQLMTASRQLVNTSSVTEDGIAITNLVCAVFVALFTVFYAALAGRKPAMVRGAASDPSEVTPAAISASGVGVTLLVCILAVAAIAPLVYHSIDDQVEITPKLLILNRYLLFLPAAALLILLQETLHLPGKIWFTRVCTLGLLLLLVLVTENPHLEKRNALGPLYLCLILVGCQRWLNSRTRRLLLLVGGMVIVFPAISVFTHNKSQGLLDVSFAEMGERIEQYYFSINYDAWANVYTSVEVVAKHGCQWGHQLLGSLLFFVPSSLWTTKPLSTGIFLGYYLINHYGMWFTNLSAPLVAEGYLDFGWAGVALYAGVLAFLVNLLNNLARRADRWVNLPLAMYGSMFLVFLLRGSLMVAMGFAAGAFLSFVTAHMLLSTRLGLRPSPLYARS